MQKLKLNSEQLSAANHLDGPGLTLAVPGSGKTTLLLFRIINLVSKHKISPDRILSVTFSKASAKDMERRYNSLFPDQRTIKPNFSTIHSFCYNIVSQYFRKKALPYTLIEGDSKISKLHIIRNISNEHLSTPLSDDGLEQLQNEISYFKNMMLTSESYDKEDLNTENFIEIYNSYESYKQRNHMIDFDDMLTITHKILIESKITRKYFENRYDYIQIDEAQDTSNIQFEILKLISNNKSNLFFVADDDQSIYSFRGANPQNLLNFKMNFKDGKIYKLKMNYRSTEKICSLCNTFIDQNQLRYEKKMLSGKLDSSEGKIQIVNFDTIDERNSFILSKFKNLENKTAILFRNNVSSIGISYMFFKEDIDFLIKDKSISFFNHFVSRDIESFLKFSMAPNDISIFEKIYYKMDIFIKEDALQYLYRNNRGRNIFDTLKESDMFSRTQTEQLKNLKEYFEELPSLTPYDAIKKVEGDIGYIKFLDRISKNKNSSYKLFQNHILQLKIIAGYSQSIIDFLMELDAFKEALDYSSKNYLALANLSTFHSSKGLEYDDVFIIDSPDFSKDEDKIKLIEEERRLFYVAMTRAKNNLFILNHKFKEGFYEKKSSFISFIEEQENVEIIQNKVSASWDLNASEVKDTIMHTLFGKGKVLSVEGDSITISFEDKIRTLSYSICKEKNFI